MPGVCRDGVRYNVSATREGGGEGDRVKLLPAVNSTKVERDTAAMGEREREREMLYLSL